MAGKFVFPYLYRFKNMSTQNSNTDVTIFEAMLGKTFSRFEILQDDKAFASEYKGFKPFGYSYYDSLYDAIKYADSEVMAAVDSDGLNIHLFFHSQDCCENVRLEDITGDLTDLVGYPLLQAELVTECSTNGEWGESVTWSFYKFATVKGSVTVRWLGESNGYYSETVDHHHMTRK